MWLTVDCSDDVRASSRADNREFALESTVSFAGTKLLFAYVLVTNKQTNKKEVQL